MRQICIGALAGLLFAKAAAFFQTVPATDNFWRLVAPIAWKYVGFVWAYCLVWVFIEDWAKLHVYRHLELSAKRHRKFLERVQEPVARTMKGCK